MGTLLVLAFGACVSFFICGALGHAVGARHEAGGEGFVLGAFLGPIGILVAFALDNRRVCPLCHGRLDGRPLLCPHCRSELRCEGPAASPFAPAAESAAEALIVEDPENPGMIACPRCGILVKHYAAACPECHCWFPRPTDSPKKRG